MFEIQPRNVERKTFTKESLHAYWQDEKTAVLYPGTRQKIYNLSWRLKRE